MKTDKKILLAFLLNLTFSIIEFIGGAITGSIAIISDSIHDFGDCLSIGTSFIFEKISMKKPDDKYTFGYYRYSVLGSVIQSTILLCGSVFVAYNAVLRLINPKPINYDGMIIIGIIGFVVNFAAAYFTSGGESLNQKSINLHMLEDVIGWAIVLIGAVVMKFTDWSFLDSILSIGLAIFIIINALKNLKSVLNIFLEKTPNGIDLNEIKAHLLSVEGVTDVHHLHLWSMDGYKNAATLHVVTDSDIATIKKHIKEELTEHGISHSTIEFENIGEICDDTHCDTNSHAFECSHHHHHHH
ncbi:MAG: cation diffusion facilitator family transporter [Eubacteriales bacterium]|nr:cation diffusion facilitator family transporter [Eubacteriales bacterium]